MDEIILLHLSDLHISRESLPDIKIILNALIEDIRSLEQSEQVSVNFVCFTGDLIQRGDQGQEQLELALENFIFPLLKALGLSEEDLYIVPGNHEVDTTKIDQFIEEGFNSKLVNKEEVNDLLDRLEPKIF